MGGSGGLPTFGIGKSIGTDTLTAGQTAGSTALRGDGGAGSGIAGALASVAGALDGAVDPLAGAHPAAVESAGGGATARLGLLATMALALPAPGTDPWLAAMMRNLAVSSTVTVTTAMALFLFGRRKQEESEDEEKRRSSERPPAGDGDGRPDPRLADRDGLPDESQLPRWRRPSLMAARKSGPAPTAEQEAATRLTFDRGLVEPDATHERRRIRYRMVRLSDAADEIRSNELGRLDRGDEVELLESFGAYWKVRVPTGQIGWVHRMTLGERLDGRPASHAGGPVHHALDNGALRPTDGEHSQPDAPPDAPARNNLPDAPPPPDVFASRLGWPPAPADERLGWQPAQADEQIEGLAARLIRERHQH